MPLMAMLHNTTVMKSDIRSPRGIVDTFVVQFQSELRNCPIVDASFYDSFEHTRTGENYSHPRTIGLLVKACYSLPETVAVDVDVRFNAGGGIRFQPDVVALDKHGTHLLIVDFESPNSSDARIVGKDVEPYVDWIGTTNSQPPTYLIVTSLPKPVSSPPPVGQQRSAGRPQLRRKWKLRYTSQSGTNYCYRECKEEIESNPFSFWYDEYRKQLKALSKRICNLQQLPPYFANLDGLHIDLVDVW